MVDQFTSQDPIWNPVSKSQRTERRWASRKTIINNSILRIQFNVHKYCRWLSNFQSETHQVGQPMKDLTMTQHNGPLELLS